MYMGIQSECLKLSIVSLKNYIVHKKHSSEQKRLSQDTAEPTICCINTFLKMMIENRHCRFMNGGSFPFNYTKCVVTNSMPKRKECQERSLKKSWRGFHAFV